MKSAKLFPLLSVILIPIVSNAQNLSISVATQGIETIALPNGQQNYTLQPGSFNDSETTDGSGNDWVDHAFASLASSINLSGNTLSVSGSGSVSASLSRNFGSSGASAHLGIQANFSIDSPFTFSIQANVTESSSSGPAFVGLANLSTSSVVFLYGAGNNFGFGPSSGPSSGIASGTLQPGQYEFKVDCSVQWPQTLNNWADQSSFDATTFSVTPIVPEPSAAWLVAFGTIGIALQRIRKLPMA